MTQIASSEENQQIWRIYCHYFPKHDQILSLLKNPLERAKKRPETSKCELALRPECNSQRR